MNVLKTLLLLALAAHLPLYGQTKYATQINSKIIKSLQIRQEGELFSEPFAALNGDKAIEINFDALNPGYSRYAYKIIFCNADWTPSNLSPVEYLDGFQDDVIEDFATSMSTTTQYTNYRVFFPNEDVRLKLAGNYAVQFYEEDNPSKIVFTACFSLVEPMVNIAANVSGNTNIDTNQSHQQVSFSIQHPNMDIPYPQTDLKIWVLQNNRRDNAVTGFKPMEIRKGTIVYENIRELIFPAGNEYRRVEFLSNKYNGMGVEKISFNNPYYHIDLMKDYPKSGETYQYDQDQDGRFFIRCANCEDHDTESDYYIVHFTLAMDPILDGNIYLNGEAFPNSFDESNKMEYNPESGFYEKALLLKQGNYNYQYLFVPNGQEKGETNLVEGDYAQTENQYTIYVYYRPMGARYDRLIGIKTIKNSMNVL